MTMIDTLFGLIPAASTGQQWVARDLQLVNWGGYDGHHRVRLASTATLLSGGSGSGKSTLMDAYIALLMPHTTPFNGASNGGVVGRPRGKDQRNILSYARGKVDESRTEDGTRQRVLRGDGRDTWSAIAMTWADQSGTELTAVRAWYVPSAARTLDDVVPVRATFEGAFDVRALEPAAAQRLARPAVTATGLTAFDTDRDFTARLHATLGIGASGDGSKAVALLGRIQAGQQITTVDALYKAMVLEEPDTFETADAVVEQFDKLSGTREQMITARQQVKALEPIREHRAAIGDAGARLRVVEEIGTFDDAASPAALWRHERRLGLLRSVEQDLQRRHQQAQHTAVETTGRIAAAKSELDGVKETLWSSGGDRLATAQRELKGTEARLDEVTRARARLDEVLRTALGSSVGSESELADLTARARVALQDTEVKATARQSLFDALSEKKEASADLAELRAERAAVTRRRDNIPGDLHAARAALAQAAGLTPDDLPFVAELVEVRTEHEPWREAFNLALGGFATRILLDAAHLGAFRKAIDAVPTARRIRFEGVPTGMRDDVGLDARTLPGRLDYRGGPFTGWLRSELARRFAYVCVDTPGELSQHPKALTRSGQVSEGTQGAHGGQGHANVLGFTNTRRLAHLDAQVARAEQRLAGAERQVVDAEQGLDGHEARLRAYATLVELTWDQVDVASVEAERARWAQVIDDVMGGNPEVTRLQRRTVELETTIRTLTEELGRTKGTAEQLGERWSSTTDEVDVAQRALDDAQDAGTTVGPEQRAYLDGLLATDVAVESLEAFDAVLARANDVLRADRQAAQQTIGAARDALRRTFETFVERWPDPNLGTDPDASYADFERILGTLESNGLHELEAEWRKSLLRLSGNDLTDLHNALSRSVREIKERIRPVNDILADLPFADDDHRLRIDARDTQSTVVARFRKELRDLREVLSTEATDAERERRYVRMAKVIDRIRRTAPDFADLVDVRRHVRLSAEKVDLDGGHVALYDHIGEKSGGESQELVAFIVGAALRYQLGDAGAERPRYAPVFLDEALIKADARFTGRAVGAWRGLGFQLVIGAPNDKFGALEPHVDVKYVVLKDASGRSRTKPVAGVAADV
ncbi:ATP-binding protein [Cellulomonas chitinilytica]|uniref:ATP-binding protein n=1 Tax=Cellulomonas chitinilytica TaxID=398759 RepID=A0A919P4R3_9CELL|nr:SbcC/MukB-like Walker B domain-containing protein [Cellulomonas chitinilytica]GIG20999.1 ATP-binding protein [Cellulomonas chitinilytica]